MAKWLQRNPLRYLFQWKGWKSTLSSSSITFSEREPLLRGLPWWNSCNYWSQRCIGVSKTCGRRNFLKGRSFGDFPRNFVSLLFQICFIRSKRFRILPLDGGPQHLIHVKLCWFHLGKKFEYFFDTNIIFLINLDLLHIQYITKWMFSKRYIRLESVFFSFLTQGSEHSHFWCCHISAINLYPGWLMNLAQ